VDAELGRLLDWHADRDRDERWTVIVASDHGHVAVSEKVDAGENLRGAGFPTGPGGILSSFGRYGALALPAERRELLAPLAEFLSAAPWVAAVFARDAAGPLPGTLPMSLIGCDGPRAPDLMIALHGSRDAWTAGGLSGQGLMDSDTVPVGGSAHGGLLPEELATVLAASGPGFDRGRASDAPAGVADIAPTAAALLGLAGPASERGLLEDRRSDSVQVGNHAVPGRPGRRLRTRRYGARVYVDGIYGAGGE
jgi:arylsulfatase A-like enzyme